MKHSNLHLDAYEQDVLNSYESGEWQPVPNQAAANLEAKELAAAALAKTRRVNIRMTSMTLEGMQARAAEEGLPYQTLMASVLHKYASGRLVDGLQFKRPIESASPAR